jgi:hypothetical protein
MSQKNQKGHPTTTTIYLKYTNLEDMLKVIVYAAQSPIGLTPMLYHVKHNNDEILFVESGAVNPVIHYIIQDEKPSKKFIELRRLTGEYVFVDKIGNDTQSIYVPILELEKCSFNFPL